MGHHGYCISNSDGSRLFTSYVYLGIANFDVRQPCKLDSSGSVMLSQHVDMSTWLKSRHEASSLGHKSMSSGGNHLWLPWIRCPIVCYTKTTTTNNSLTGLKHIARCDQLSICLKSRATTWRADVHPCLFR